MVLEKGGALLRAAGHEVYTPTLTGLGDRSHLLGPGVSLDTHVQDIVGLLEYEDLREAVVVGHSYGGMVMTAVADRAADRRAQLVYLDAFVPQHGQSLADLADRAFFATMEARAGLEGDGWRVPAPPLERWASRKRPSPLDAAEDRAPFPEHFQGGGAVDERGSQSASAHLHLLHGQVGRGLARVAREAAAGRRRLALPRAGKRTR